MSYGMQILTQYGMVDVTSKRLARLAGALTLSVPSTAITATLTAPSGITSSNAFAFHTSALNVTMTFSGSTVTVSRLGDYNGGAWSIQIYFMRIK